MTTRTDKGAKPHSQKMSHPWGGAPPSSGSSNPQRRETGNQETIPTTRRDPDTNALEKGAPGTPGGGSLCQVVPRTPKGGRPISGSSWPREVAGEPPGRAPRTHPAPGRRQRPRPPGSGPSACSSCCQAPTSPGTPGSPPAHPAAPWTWLRRGRPAEKPGLRGDGDRAAGHGAERSGRRGATLRGDAALTRLSASPAPEGPAVQLSGPAPNVTLRGRRASQRSAAAARTRA